ncbi:MAG: DNA polymerase III subunit gamma/tau [Gammaproteobacteria bacterium]|nr:MAG: DNA polymerase III subunit gamma/tau [Gammaproteobacteria bacterium]
MSYQVLARKWRPRNFGEVVGQEHVLRALVNALDNDRLHHAFLFTGTRGVGKTTLARVLAKSLNCEKGVSSTPCGACSACREIDEGRFVDLIEVDAASRTKVEDTRELLENVQYAPTRGRYKVYLIDEVHMLSGHSFNALLKTLEEPPPHVKFLLATTDPQKLPVTILSRCLQFNLKRLPVELIQQRLAGILAAEKIAGEPAALSAIARAADGSLRDALSLLDQAIAYGAGAVRADEVRAMLGSIEQTHVIELLDALAGAGSASDAQALLACTQRLAEHAADFTGVLAEMLSTLQRIALAQVAPQTLDDSQGDREAVLKLAHAMTPEDVQLYYQIGINGRRDLPFAPDVRTGFEMTLLRMLAFRPAESGAMTDAAPPAVKSAASAAPAAQSVATQPAAGAQDNDWANTVAALRLSGMARELALHCTLNKREGETLHLALDSAHAKLHTKNLEERLQQTLQQHYGAPVKLVIKVGSSGQETPAQQQSRVLTERQQAAVQAVTADPNVQALCETFQASVDPNSIRLTE